MCHTPHPTIVTQRVTRYQQMGHAQLNQFPNIVSSKVDIAMIEKYFMSGNEFDLHDPCMEFVRRGGRIAAGVWLNLSSVQLT